MDLQQRWKVKFKSQFGPSDGAIVLCWQEEMEVVRLLFTAG